MRWLLLVAMTACTGEIAGGPDPGLPDASLPDAAISPCNPTGGGPYWLEETQTVAFDLACTGPNQTALEIVSPPAGLAYDAATKHVTWTPGLDQAAVWELTVRAPETGETALVKIGVADKFDAPGNVPIVDATKYPEEFGIPVFHLDYTMIEFDIDHPGTLAYRGGTYAIDVKYRGNTTSAYPKKSYTMSFPATQKFNDPARGFNGKRKVCLTTTFDDTSQLRHRLAFHLWMTLDPGHVFVQTYSAVVYTNGVYQGVYEVSDRITGEMIDDFGYSEDGSLYEAINHDGNFKTTRANGTAKGSLADGYEKKGPIPLDDFTDLIALVTFVTGSSAADFKNLLATKLDLRDFQDWWIHATAIAADDNMEKNSFLYHDPVGGLWRYIPWDYNGSFGQDWETMRQAANGNHEGTTNGLFNRMRAEPTFAAAMNTRYGTVLRGVWDEATVLATFDAWVAELRPAALRDERRWFDEHKNWGAWDQRTDIKGFDGETAYMRAWIHDRWVYLRNRYP